MKFSIVSTGADGEPDCDELAGDSIVCDSNDVDGCVQKFMEWYDSMVFEGTDYVVLHADDKGMESALYAIHDFMNGKGSDKFTLVCDSPYWLVFFELMSCDLVEPIVRKFLNAAKANGGLN